MSDKLYAIILDRLDRSFDPSALRDVMKTFGGITHWWNHSEGHPPERSWKWLRQRESELTGSN